jgi:RNA recognition motif-containing protein
MSEEIAIIKPNELALIEASELSLVDNNNLNDKQLALILKRTPAQYVKTRPAKGGGTWDYVPGGYMKKILNLMFGWDWDFEIIEDKIIHGEVIVKGRLTCRSNGKEIVKMQYGNKDIAYKTEKVFNDDGTAKMIQKYGKTMQETRPSEIPLSIGNDLKSAATDCLKKCAAEIGIAADIYNKDDFKEVKVALDDDVEAEHYAMKELFEFKQNYIPANDFDGYKKVIDKKQVKAYPRTKSYLEKIIIPD